MLEELKKDTLPENVCPRCHHNLEGQAKFCGVCGLAKKATDTLPPPERQIQAVPQFALVAPDYFGVDGHDLRDEYHKLVVLMARERVCFLLHIATFVVVSLIGLGLGIRCYWQLPGDHMTRLMAACVPMFWINIGALASVSFAKRTKKEMQALSQRIWFVRFKMENRNLIQGLN